MTVQEVMLIKKYAEGAYPQLKQDEGNDLVWIDMLSPYELLGIKTTLQNYIRKGNKFPPTIADLISGYEMLLNSFDEDIINRMIQDNVFEGDEWNKPKNIEKARAWLSHPLKERVMPDWFREMYLRYKNQFEIQYFSPSNQKLLGGNY